jgi:hypothetical protein
LGASRRRFLRLWAAVLSEATPVLTLSTAVLRLAVVFCTSSNWVFTRPSDWSRRVPNSLTTGWMLWVSVSLRSLKGSKDFRIASEVS